MFHVYLRVKGIRVKVLVDHDKQEPETGYKGYCDCVIIGCEYPILLLNNLLEDKITDFVSRSLGKDIDLLTDENDLDCVCM